MPRLNKPHEHGSEFHWPLPLFGERGWRPKRARYYASGRDAIRSLLRFGREQLGWKRVWLPGYFCQEVASSLLDCGLEVMVYADSPLQMSPNIGEMQFEQADVLVHVNYFGLRTQSNLPDVGKHGVAVIEDHTHDPLSSWAQHSNADYCVSSLRKTLPVPDGGILWSPQGHPLPAIPELTSERELASLKKLGGMVLKGLYLEGGDISKDQFRALLTEGEERVATGTPSAMTRFSLQLLRNLPIAAWRDKRRANFLSFARSFEAPCGIALLQPTSTELTPFCCVMQLDEPEMRDRLRDALIRENIYPAVLWALDAPAVSGIAPEETLLGRRVLSLHCDQRYTPDDMEHLAMRVTRLYEQIRA